MKNAKKIVLALLLIAVVVVGGVVATMANDVDYKGDIKKLGDLVQKAYSATTVELKEEALTAVADYLVAKPVDPASKGYGDVIEQYIQARLDIIDLYIAAADEADTDSATIKNAQAADKWFLLTFDTDEMKEDERYAPTLDKVHTSNVAVANALYATVNQSDMSKTNTDAATVTADGRYKQANQFVTKAVFDVSRADYADISSRMEALTALYNESVANRYALLTSQAKISDYGVKPVYQNNFEGTTASLSLANYDGYDAMGKTLRNSGGKQTEVLADGTTNTYYAMTINGARSKAGTSYLSTYFTLSFAGINDRFILEFDLSSKTTLPNNAVYFQSRPTAGTNTWMTLKPNGDLVDHNGALLAEKAVVPGEWTHICIVGTIENINQSSLYVNYAYAGVVMGDHKGYGYVPENMRVGNSANASGQLCIDNIYASNNGSICNQQYLTSMDELTRFEYLVDYMQRTSGQKFATVPDCVLAHEQAAALVGNFAMTDPDTNEITYKSTIESIEDPVAKEAAKKAVNEFYAYDPSAIILQYKLSNLAKYRDMVIALEGLAKAPTSSSINARNNQITKMKTFINANSSYMYTDVDPTLGYNYDELVARFNAVVERVAQDQVISKFISTMSGFEDATSAVLLQSKYDSATKIIRDGINTELLGTGAPGDPYAEFYRHYYETYANAPAKILAAKKDANSRSIINSINYLLSTYPDESDWRIVYIENPTTDEEKAINERYTFIDDYVKLIRKKLSGGDYNPDYVSEEGVSVDMVIQKFSAMSDYYYSTLQLVHISEISAQFEAFEKTDSYFEKKGIISYIQRYLNSEDVDFRVEFTCSNVGCASSGVAFAGTVKDVAHPTCNDCGEAPDKYTLVSDRADLTEILRKYTAYEAELAPQEGNYEDLLAQNTVFFVNTVKKFDTAITYVDKLALLNEAMPYYYAMNISDDEVREAIAKYDALQAELNVVQRDSKDFVENVLMLVVALEQEGIDAYYEYLVYAATLRDKVDESIDGVVSAIEIYEKALESYELETGKVNSELKESINALGSLGANCGFTAVLSVILRQLVNFG